MLNQHIQNTRHFQRCRGHVAPIANGLLSSILYWIGIELSDCQQWLVASVEHYISLAFSICIHFFLYNYGAFVITDRKTIIVNAVSCSISFCGTYESCETTNADQKNECGCDSFSIHSMRILFINYQCMSTLGVCECEWVLLRCRSSVSFHSFLILIWPYIFTLESATNKKKKHLNFNKELTKIEGTQRM